MVSWVVAELVGLRRYAFGATSVLPPLLDVNSSTRFLDTERADTNLLRAREGVQEPMISVEHLDMPSVRSSSPKERQCENAMVQ